MPFAPGHAKAGGRIKGSKNKRTKQFLDALEAALAWMPETPEMIQARIAAGDMPCGTCHGKGKTKYQPGNSDHITDRVCQSCYGSGKERINTDQRQRASAEILKYRRPQLKAVELRNAEGETLRTTVDVVYHTTDGE